MRWSAAEGESRNLHARLAWGMPGVLPDEWVRREPGFAGPKSVHMTVSLLLRLQFTQGLSGRGCIIDSTTSDGGWSSLRYGVHRVDGCCMQVQTCGDIYCSGSATIIRFGPRKALEACSSHSGDRHREQRRRSSHGCASARHRRAACMALHADGAASGSGGVCRRRAKRRATSKAQLLRARRVYSTQWHLSHG